MLKTLEIENIAVIEKASIAFSGGLNVLTGETGAGKSIVVDSINAILGERTSKELVRHGADFACVSALFEDIDDGVCSAIRDMGYPMDEDGSVLLFRRISAQGKSACKINGMPATVSILKSVGTLLVNIHGQHDSQALLNAENHYKFIDSLAEDPSYLHTYQDAFKAFMEVRRKLKSLTAAEDTKERRLELLNFQIEELEAADLSVGERARLNARKEEITNIENIRSALLMSLYTINGDEEFSGAAGFLADIGDRLSGADALSDLAEQTQGVLEDVFTLRDAVEKRLADIDIEPGELEAVEERLDLIYRLSLKYGDSEEEMLQFLAQAKKEREDILFSEQELVRISASYDERLEQVTAAAQALSAYRKKTAHQFEKDVCAQLAFLDMPHIRFAVQFLPGKLSSTGTDNIEFLISTNPGEPPKPLAKIASGGELSRIMLAIKNIIAGNDTIGTLIFDEIDTGVSGRASRKIGLKLKSLAADTQVICVTHSAQIASVADTHFLIEKEVKSERTYTKVTPLDFDARKKELARIMGGLEITETLLSSAEELLLAARE